jgi:hypothetical protein
MRLKFIHLEFSNDSHSKIKKGFGDTKMIEVPIYSKITMEVRK